MKLSESVTSSLLESQLFEPLPIIEAGEGLRWKFDYSTYKHDPSPDILLLGNYRHPSTGNDLVGGVNLHYLSKAQRDDLAKVLPKIMNGSNLYNRYHLGKQLLPDVFKQFYRTYAAKNIRGVEQDVLYPKYGFMAATKNFIKKKIGGLFKSKAQRAKEAEPQYPTDLSNMHDTLDNVVLNLGKQQARHPSQQPDTPEMQVARNAFQKFKMDRARSMADIENQEDEPLVQATQDFQQHQLAKQAAPQQAVQPEVAQNTTPQPTPDDLRRGMERDRRENQEELLDPDNDINLETIMYYSHKDRKFIMESVDINAIEISKAPLHDRLMKLRPAMAMAAQTVYDDWDDTEFGGGICDQVSLAISGVLTDNDIENTEGGHDGDGHSYIIAYDDGNSFIVDIDPYIYESGGGYDWTKNDGVQFSPRHIMIATTDRPDWV